MFPVFLGEWIGRVVSVGSPGERLSEDSGVALWGSCRRDVGDSEGVARVRSLPQVYGLARYHPGLNQRLGFSRDQSEVGPWTFRSFVGRIRTPDWVCRAGARRPQSEGSQAVDRARVNQYHVRVRCARQGQQDTEGTERGSKS